MFYFGNNIVSFTLSLTSEVKGSPLTLKIVHDGGNNCLTQGACLPGRAHTGECVQGQGHHHHRHHHPPQVVGDYGRWQLKVVLLLWIPMFFCGTQFVTTDFMAHEPKVLFCEDKATCSSYDPTIFPSDTRSAC